MQVGKTIIVITKMKIPNMKNLFEDISHTVNHVTMISIKPNIKMLLSRKQE